MKICMRSFVPLICKETGVPANSLKQALEWVNQGLIVEAHYKGNTIGVLKYCGTINSVDELQDNSNYGEIFECNGEFFINLPDEVLDEFPDEDALNALKGESL